MELREVFEPLVNFLKNLQKKDKDTASKDKAKERLQLVLMQDRASVSPDFFEMMKKEIIDVIKKYIEIDEESLEVQLTRGFEDGDGTGPALYANIPIKNIKPVAKKVEEKDDEELVTEVVDNGEIIENTESNEKGNIDEINIEQSNENAEKVEQESKVEANQNVEIVAEETAEKQTTVKATANKTEQANNVEKADVAGTVETIDSQNLEETVKEKIAEVKDGVAETIEKVKKGAKDGIKKIKTKTQKKKINE